MNEMKKKFPNSVCLTNNTTNIDGVKADAVVYIIKTMSHALFYKVQSKFKSSDTPVVKFNGNNTELLLGTMYETLKNL